MHILRCNKNTYILKQNGHDHLSAVANHLFLLFSLKRNAEEWTGFGLKFEVSKYGFSVPLQGVGL